MRDIGPDLRSNDYKKDNDDVNASEVANETTTTKPTEPSVLKDLGEISFLILCSDYLS